MNRWWLMTRMLAINYGESVAQICPFCPSLRSHPPRGAPVRRSRAATDRLGVVDCNLSEDYRI
jgi:hypothetical protein